jgi:hypothetical protein
MTDFFNAIKKNPEYDPNLSWDKIIKSWEENFLGSNQHNTNFSNPLESDYSFDNAYSLTSNANTILSGFFDNQYVKSQNFTCINSDCMERINECNLNKKISNINIWIIKKTCDYISKPFLRLVLKKNISELEIKNLLYLFSDCEFKIEMGGVTTFKLPKLLFAYLVCEKLSNPIKLFDVGKFLESNSMEEIKNKIFKYTDKSCWINQKYYVRNSTDLYIDIPLMVDFFSYNFSTALISIQYHEITYKLIIPSNKLAMISNYLENIVLMFEEIVYSSNDFRIQLASSSHEYLKMNSKMEYFHCWKDNLMELNDYYMFSKFIFIVVRQHEITDIDLEIINKLDKDIDTSQFPQIMKVELEEVYKNCNVSNNKISTIELENIWVGQFDDFVIYGIAADGISNMKNWIKVQSECIDSIEKMTFKNNATNATNASNKNHMIIDACNINSNNYENLYCIVNLNSIKIYWSETSIQTNIEVFIINQNIQRICSGMTGEAYIN